MSATQPVGRPDHPRLTVLAAAVSVLCVLVLPGAVAWVFDLAAPVQRLPGPDLTDDAARIARLPGAAVIGDQVIVSLQPYMHAAVMADDQRVGSDQAVGELAPLGSSGLLPMNPHLAPAGSEDLAAGLFPGDHVYADLGELVAACLAAPDDAGAPCTPTLLTRHDRDLFYRFPGAWGSATFLDLGSRMQAEVYDVVGGRLVAGGLPGTDAVQVVVTFSDHSIVNADISTEVSPGNVVFWASRSYRPVSARAYDADNREVAHVDLDG